MRRRFELVPLVSLVLPAFLILAAACGSDERITAPLTLKAPPGPVAAVAPATCLSSTALMALVEPAFGTGTPNYNSGRGKVDNIIKLVDKGKIADAQAQAYSTVDYILKQWKHKGLGGSASAVSQLVSGIFCYVGLPMSTLDVNNTALIMPSDAPQVIVTSDQQAGVSFPANPVSEPTLVTVYRIDPSQFAPGAGPLETKLDQYPGYYDFVKQSATNAPLTDSVVVSVCLSTNDIDAVVKSRLRLGHQKAPGTTNFEITQPAPSSALTFLNCPDPSTLSALPSWMLKAAELVMPQQLGAQIEFLLSGGVGGTAGELSPFGPVDTFLEASGGVGGTAGELRPLGPLGQTGQRRLGRSVATDLLPPAPCPSMSAQAGTQLPAGCRPSVSVKTHRGTVLTGVPVDFAVTQGGGQVAAEQLGEPDCGPFGATVRVHTNAAGAGRACWLLGATPGTNKVTGTPATGGDAPPGVTYVPAVTTFTATGTAPVPTTIEVSPATASITVGGTQAFTATVKDALGNPMTGQSIAWSSSNAAVATVNASGLATGISTGTVTITATSGALSANATLAVVSLCSLDGLFPFGSATATTGDGCYLRLAPAQGGQAGGAWSKTKIKVANGFETEFTFRMSNPSSWVCDGFQCGADGIAFVIQGDNGESLGGTGGGIGYDGIPKSVAVELDSWWNGDRGDPNSNHIGVQSCGVLPNTVSHNGSCDFGKYVDPGDFNDGVVRTLKVTYVPGTLRVYLDGTLVLTSNITFTNINGGNILDADGKAWVGFTAATGAAFADHDILSWTFSGAP